MKKSEIKKTKKRSGMEKGQIKARISVKTEKELDV